MPGRKRPTDSRYRVRRADVTLRVLSAHSHPPTRPTTGNIRLTQGTSTDDFLQDLEDLADQSEGTEDIDRLLEQAREITQEQEGSTTVLDAFDALEAMPDTDQERMRDNLGGELDDLLPNEDDLGDADVDPLQDDNEFSAEDEAFADGLVDPKPQPVYQPKQRRSNQPYTLAGIFEDDDKVEPCCEAEYCRRMWACAGGKNLSTWQRMRRDMQRNRQIIKGGGASQACNPMKDFTCPKVSNLNNQYGNSGYGPGGYEGHRNGYYGQDTGGTYVEEGQGDFYFEEGYLEEGQVPGYGMPHDVQSPTLIHSLPTNQAPIQASPNRLLQPARVGR